MHGPGPVPDERLFAVLATLVGDRGDPYPDRGSVRDGEAYGRIKEWLEAQDADALQALDWLSLEMGIDVSRTLPPHDGQVYPLRPVLTARPARPAGGMGTGASSAPIASRTSGRSGSARPG